MERQRLKDLASYHGRLARALDITMQHHHIDPIDVRAPDYCHQRATDEARPAIPHRLRQFIFQTISLGSIISVAYLTLGII